MKKFLRRLKTDSNEHCEKAADNYAKSVPRLALIGSGPVAVVGRRSRTYATQTLKETLRKGEMMVSESLSPYHQQAEDEGTYVLAERAREVSYVRPEGPAEGPSENTD